MYFPNVLLPLLAATGAASIAQGRRVFLEFFDFPIVFYQCEKFLTVFVEPLRSHCFLSVNDLHRVLHRERQTLIFTVANFLAVIEHYVNSKNSRNTRRI